MPSAAASRAAPIDSSEIFSSSRTVYAIETHVAQALLPVLFFLVSPLRGSSLYYLTRHLRVSARSALPHRAGLFSVVPVGTGFSRRSGPSLNSSPLIIHRPPLSLFNLLS